MELLCYVAGVHESHCCFAGTAVYDEILLIASSFIAPSSSTCCQSLDDSVPHSHCHPLRLHDCLTSAVSSFILSQHPNHFRSALRRRDTLIRPPAQGALPSPSTNIARLSVHTPSAISLVPLTWMLSLYVAVPCAAFYEWGWKAFVRSVTGLSQI